MGGAKIGDVLEINEKSATGVQRAVDGKGRSRGARISQRAGIGHGTGTGGQENAAVVHRAGDAADIIERPGIRDIARNPARGPDVKCAVIKGGSVQLIGVKGELRIDRGQAGIGRIANRDRAAGWNGKSGQIEGKCASVS